MNESKNPCIAVITQRTRHKPQRIHSGETPPLYMHLLEEYNVRTKALQVMDDLHPLIRV